MSHLAKSKVLFLLLRDSNLDGKKYNINWGSEQNQGIALRDLRATASGFNDNVGGYSESAVMRRKLATKRAISEANSFTDVSLPMAFSKANASSVKEGKP